MGSAVPRGMEIVSSLRQLKALPVRRLVQFVDGGRRFLSLRSGLLILLVVFSAFAARAENLCSEVFTRNLWEITPRVEKNKFVTNRGFYEYKEILPADFALRVASLRPEQHWVDLGAGKANAQIEYLKGFSEPRTAALTTAVAYKLDRWFRPGSFDGKLVIKEGAFESHVTSTWQKADVVTDVFGVVSYTHDLQTSFQKIFDLLNTGGELYLAITPYATHFLVQGRALPMIDFLATIEGLRVEGRFGSIKVTKDKDQIKIPNLKLKSIKDDTPPYRYFEVGD